MADIIIKEDEDLKMNGMEEASGDFSARRRTSFISDEVTNLLKTSQQASVKQFATRLSVISRNYDLDGDGVLDEAEKALRKMDGGDGTLDKTAVYQHIQELMQTQKQLMNTRRILTFVTAFAVLMLLSIFGLSFAVAKLTDDTDVVSESNAEEMGTVELKSTGSSDSNPVIIATVAEGHTIHVDGALTEDPFGLTTNTGSLFFPSGRVETDSYKCTMADYLTGSTLLGSVENCLAIYHAAEKSQTISFLSADERNLRPGQSIVTLSMTPTESWADPMIADPKFSFYSETVHMVKGTIGGECKLLVFVESAGKSDCPYYEIPGCVVPECVANPPEYEPAVEANGPNENPYYPQP
jgi:hypothetical protein